ncbi:heavy metal-associated isoprenylated plant protein 16-like isoform X1 [Nicotiana tabacum]|uniref:Heavy metal-associated isoprenylated plant protein 16-like isoform X1 n=1 Tax=Nicotiana tabacum TaxID=4097 RepID=A0AC58TM66_TOBAC
MLLKIEQQKIVIRLCTNGNDQKSRSKALKIAVSQRGVESAAMQGGENNLLEVEGVQIDAVKLTKLLRKKLKQAAELLIVGPVDKKDGDKKEGPKMEVAMMQWPSYNYPYYVVPQFPLYEVRDSYQNGCSIL